MLRFDQSCLPSTEPSSVDPSLIYAQRRNRFGWPCLQLENSNFRSLLTRCAVAPIGIANAILISFSEALKRFWLLDISRLTYDHWVYSVLEDRMNSGLLLRRAEDAQSAGTGHDKHGPEVLIFTYYHPRNFASDRRPTNY